MGYYPYEQECIHGHQWGAAFISVNMTDTGQKRCPECGCYKVRTVWHIPGECYVKHNAAEWEQEKKAIEKGERWRRGMLDWDEKDPPQDEAGGVGAKG